MPKFFQSILVTFAGVALIGCTSSTNLTLQDMNCESSNIIIKTSLGEMHAELYPDLVPDTVKNFCYHIAEKNFEDIICVEVLDNKALKLIAKSFKGRDFFFITPRYDFMHHSGFMAKNIKGLLKTFLFGGSNIEILHIEDLMNCRLEFIPLLFAIPEKYREQFKNVEFPDSVEL